MSNDQETQLSARPSGRDGIALSSRQQIIGRILKRMYRAFQVREPETDVFVETIYAWDEALSRVPDTYIEAAYREAYQVRVNAEPDDGAPANDYPLKAVEVLRAFHNIRQTELSAGRGNDASLSYEDRVAAISRRGTDYRRAHADLGIKEPNTPWGSFKMPPPRAASRPTPTPSATTATTRVEPIEIGRPDPRLAEVDGIPQWVDSDPDLPF